VRQVHFNNASAPLLLDVYWPWFSSSVGSASDGSLLIAISANTISLNVIGRFTGDKEDLQVVDDSISGQCAECRDPNSARDFWALAGFRGKTHTNPWCVTHHP